MGDLGHPRVPRPARRLLALTATGTVTGEGGGRRLPAGRSRRGWSRGSIQRGQLQDSCGDTTILPIGGAGEIAAVIAGEEEVEVGDLLAGALALDRDACLEDARQRLFACPG